MVSFHCLFDGRYVYFIAPPLTLIFVKFRIFNPCQQMCTIIPIQQRGLGLNVSVGMLWPAKNTLISGSDSVIHKARRKLKQNLLQQVSMNSRRIVCGFNVIVKVMYFRSHLEDRSVYGKSFSKSKVFTSIFLFDKHSKRDFEGHFFVRV